jgi:hypothetical protein
MVNLNLKGSQKYVKIMYKKIIAGHNSNSIHAYGATKMLKYQFEQSEALNPYFVQ